MLNKYKMSTTKIEEKIAEHRKKLSLEVCDNFVSRLNPAQSKEIKIGAIIAIRNFIKESHLDDPILLSFLIDTMSDPDKEVKEFVAKIIEEVETLNP